VNENVSLVISRQILTDFCAQLEHLPDPDAKVVAHFTLDKIHTRVISFEEQVSHHCSFSVDKISSQICLKATRQETRNQWPAMHIRQVDIGQNASIENVLCTEGQKQSGCIRQMTDLTVLLTGMVCALVYFEF
jgi:hypothetical protein